MVRNQRVVGLVGPGKSTFVEPLCDEQRAVQRDPRSIHCGAAALVLAVCGCTSAVSSPATRPNVPHEVDNRSSVAQATHQKNCTPWATISDGPNLYSNNMFNEAKSKGPHEQCLTARDGDGTRELGWSWQWPGFEVASFGYPEIIFGKKPWEAHTTDPRLPLRIADLQTLVVDYHLESEGTGIHPLTLGIWLTTSDATFRPTWTEIAGEVAIWLDFVGDASPEGQKIGALELGDGPYELWRDENHGDRGDGKGWTYYTLKGPKFGPQARVSAGALMHAMVNAGYCDSSVYVSSVEFGNEVRSGAGSTWVKHYRVEVEGATSASYPSSLNSSKQMP